MSDLRQLRYLQALNEAIRQEMQRTSSAFIVGEDIRENLRGETRGLYAEFGKLRVLDAPISEAAFAGLAVGAAMDGMRPIVELQIPSLVYMVFDQIVNQAAKLPFMMGGQVRLPITYLVMASGNRPGLAGQHSDNPYAFLAHAGVAVACPSNAFDAKGLTTTAMRMDDPVAVFAPAAILGAKCAVPEEPYEVPFGVARIVREGTDVTVVAIGHLVEQAALVADSLLADSISIEVIDPRTLFPLDGDAIFASVEKTGHLVIFDDSNSFSGLSAEIGVQITERDPRVLKSRINRVTRPGVPVPFSVPLEAAVLPNGDDLRRAILSQLREESAA